METTGERLRYSIESQYGSVKQFCEKFEIHYPGLTSILNNKRSLGMEVLQQIKTALPNIDTEWLLFGTERKNLSNYDNTSADLKFAEPKETYEADPVELMILKYLDRPAVQEKIRKLFNDRK